MFKKILIANRGEIAVRIIRACRELGIRSAVIYSEADRTALHVRRADEAYPIGPPPSTESYLRIDNVIDAAKRCRADAIHPGYGFLSENANFAQACEDAHITLIGPSAKSMRLMSSKVEARRALAAAGIRTVPGTYETLSSYEEALQISREIGFPIMLKATAGGGGKGMRLVSKEEDLSSAFRDASSEAKSAFNDPSLYVEKYLSHPRHIEIQILADSHGGTVYLGERECSIQRRHQKVIEECPSPIMSASLREKMGQAAVNVAKTAGYRNAGTVEFLVDSEKNFYFLEMNTRLQVEHPITEMVTGIDIVKEQIAIAEGRKLSFSQNDIKMQGAAIECRISAEDPDNHFFPSPGKITLLEEPSGPGVRCDSGVYESYEVPLFYDPLIAKLIAFGRDRKEAIARMRRSLGEYKVMGIRTTIPFFLEVLEDEKFLKGDYSTTFVEDFLKRRRAARQERQDIARIAAAIDFYQQGVRANNAPHRTDHHSQWKHAGRVKAITSKL